MPGGQDEVATRSPISPGFTSATRFFPVCTGPAKLAMNDGASVISAWMLSCTERKFKNYLFLHCQNSRWGTREAHRLFPRCAWDAGKGGRPSRRRWVAVAQAVAPDKALGSCGGTIVEIADKAYSDVVDGCVASKQCRQDESKNPQLKLHPAGPIIETDMFVYTMMAKR